MMQCHIQGALTLKGCRSTLVVFSAHYVDGLDCEFPFVHGGVIQQFQESCIILILSNIGIGVWCSLQGVAEQKLRAHMGSFCVSESLALLNLHSISDGNQKKLKKH